MAAEKVIVIGSGFGGLGTACRLAAKGYDVSIFEKRDMLGGRGYVYEQDGFKFDGGPTVITAPFMFDDIFAAAGKKREDYVTFTKCTPFYRIFDHEGKSFDYTDDVDFNVAQIKERSPKDMDGYRRFLETTKPIFQKGFIELADQPFLNFTDMLKVAPDLIKMQSYLSVYKYATQFIEDDFLRQCFSFHPLLIGGNPFDSPSIYAMIHYLEKKWGVWFAMGGTGALVQALGTLFEELGGKIHLEADVAEITVDNNRTATGITLANGTHHAADHVVSNADVAFTYSKLLEKQKKRKYTKRKVENTRYSMSLFVIYFGTKRRYTDTGLRHHNIILGERYEELLTDIFKRKIVADDFSLYLHMPTYTDPSLAPEGCENFYVLSPVPHLDSGTDWETFAPEYKDRILQFLEDNYLPDLRENIISEHYIDPLHFRDTLNSWKGSAFSIEPTLTQSAWFRPHNKSEEFENLYFVGASTHPGAGLPGVLSSSIIAERLISGDAFKQELDMD